MVFVMNIYAIGDLHLPGGQEKPMDIFGSAWTDHAAKIAQAWHQTVGRDDLVLVPGDISWAMKLDEAADDLAYLGALPGRIVLIRGNHDYWWQAIGRVRSALPPNVTALQNDYVPLTEDSAICGSRGWSLPGHDDFDADDERIYHREVERLRLSLEAAVGQGKRPVIVMMHFPPTVQGQSQTDFTDLMEAYGVQLCVYGHLHGAGHQKAVRGLHRGVAYALVSCDAIGFAPRLVGQLTSGALRLVDEAQTPGPPFNEA